MNENDEKLQFPTYKGKPLVRCGDVIYYGSMPPIPGSTGIAGAAGSFLSATNDSVVRTIAATDAAFCSAERVTFVGSTMPKEIMNIFNSVFVDCTASPAVAGLYEDFLEHNISVVAANKIAASSAYDNYVALKQTARRRGVKFLFETNVGAGLPIINTINDLIHSGDKILKIEAVLSGTLNYIFNKISAEIPFSETIKMAQCEHYSEPDPRIDLSGKDVIRKLLILSREAGYRLEFDDIEKHLFIPESYFKGTLEEFWEKIPLLDADFEARRKVLEAQHKRWRFIATFENGKASVGLEEVNADSPFYALEGSNNIILLTTQRYHAP